MALDGDVKIAGQDFKKKQVAIGVAGVGGVALLYYMKKRSATSASTTTATTDPNAIDPATGQIAGSAADTAALQSQSSGILGDNASSVSGDGSVIGYDATGQPVFGNGGSVGQPIGPGNYTSNAMWAQAFEQQVGSTGADGIAAALGKYLTAQPLTADQITTVQEAIAGQGYPPQGGPLGYPPSFHTIPAPPRVQNPPPKPKPPPPGKKPPVPPVGGGTQHYTVKRGDTLSGIAAAHHMSWETLYAMNKGVIGNNPNVIRPGEVLKV